MFLTYLNECFQKVNLCWESSNQGNLEKSISFVLVKLFLLCQKFFFLKKFGKKMFNTEPFHIDENIYDLFLYQGSNLYSEKLIGDYEKSCRIYVYSMNK